MSKKIDIKSVVVCDIIRKEAGNKSILIGVYGGELVFNKLPITMTSIAIWLLIKPSKLSYKKIRLEIVGPDKKALVGGEGSVSFGTTSEYVGLDLPPFSNIKFQKAGEHKVKLTLDEDSKYITSFRVKADPSVPEMPY